MNNFFVFDRFVCTTRHKVLHVDDSMDATTFHSELFLLLSFCPWSREMPLLFQLMKLLIDYFYSDSTHSSLTHFISLQNRLDKHMQFGSNKMHKKKLYMIPKYIHVCNLECLFHLRGFSR